jgi:hypothetical protein
LAGPSNPPLRGAVTVVNKRLNAIDTGLLRELQRYARRARAAADRRDVDTRDKGRRRGNRDLERAVQKFVGVWSRLPEALKQQYETLLAEMVALRLGAPGRRLTRA